MLRELAEETGLRLAAGHAGDVVRLLCAWESAYPTVAELGQPQYHHLVLYYRVAMPTVSSVDAGVLQVDTDEVSAFCWLDQAQIAAVVTSMADPVDMSRIGDYRSVGLDELFE